MNMIYDSPRIQWSAHRSNGGTGITKITDRRHVTEFQEVIAAMKKAGKLSRESPEIWIAGAELHSTLNDLGEFWALDRKMFPNWPDGKPKLQ